MKRPTPSRDTAPVTRVAIYTRQSVASDLLFGSIDAQREAVEAYVVSQRGAGWVAIPTRYDDHGFSGGNTDRPAFQRLMADVASKQVDVIATYKIDRISRSLPDFTGFMATLERLGVGFVSTTQSFDTRTSMGRLTLNILASFSQFERETISERTRDKILATRKRGAWTGGRPILGYDIVDGCLAIHLSEAEAVREIYRLYLAHGGLVSTVTELARRGIRNKRWKNASGKDVGGRAFDKGTLRTLLTNVLYTGLQRCGDQLVPGVHEAIVEQEVFDAAATMLKTNVRTVRAAPSRWGAILTGILCCARCGSAMTHAANNRGTRVHRYYACTKLQREGAASCPGSRAPAVDLEEVVLARVRAAAQDPRVLLATFEAAQAAKTARQPQIADELARLTSTRTDLLGQQQRLVDALTSGTGGMESITNALGEIEESIATVTKTMRELRDEEAALRSVEIDETMVRRAMAEFTRVWDALDSRERMRVLRLLVERVRYDGEAGEVTIDFRENGIAALAHPEHDRRTA